MAASKAAAVAITAPKQHRENNEENTYKCTDTQQTYSLNSKYSILFVTRGGTRDVEHVLYSRWLVVITAWLIIERQVPRPWT